MIEGLTGRLLLFTGEQLPQPSKDTDPLLCTARIAAMES